MKHACYDPLTGIIHCTVDGPEGRVLPPATGLLVMAADVNPATHYMPGGVITPRAEMAPTISATSIEADGIEECEISGLPDPCEVSITGATNWEGTLTGGTLILTATQPGDIAVQAVAAPEYLVFRTVIHAT